MQNTLSVLAYELLTACQAVDIRRRVGPWGEGLSPVCQKVFDLVREKISFMEQDREMRDDITAIEALVRDHRLLDAVCELLPEFT